MEGCAEYYSADLSEKVVRERKLEQHGPTAGGASACRYAIFIVQHSFKLCHRCLVLLEDFTYSGDMKAVFHSGAL